MKAITVLLIGLYFATATFAATFTWKGTGGNNLWSNPDNWSPVGVPQNGDELNFFDICPAPIGCPTFTVVNDLNNLRVAEMHLGNPDGPVSYIINGNPLRLTTTVYVGTQSGDDTELANITFNCPLILDSDVVRIEVAYGGWGGIPYDGRENRLFLNGPINLNGHNLDITLYGNVQNSRSRADISGAISGAGNVQITTWPESRAEFNSTADNLFAGTLTLDGWGDFYFNKTGGAAVTNRLVVDNTRLFLRRPNQIGDAATVEIRDGAAFYFQGQNETFKNLDMINADVLLDTEGGVLTVLNRITTELGTATIRGHLAMSTDLNCEINGSQFYGLDIQAAISGAGDLTKTGTAALKLSGDNTFTGALFVNTGAVEAAHIHAFGSVTREVFLRGGTVRLNNIAISGESLFSLNDDSALFALGTSTWAGEIRLEQDLQIYGENLTIAHVITGPGGLHLFGGTITLTDIGQNAFTGTTEVRCELLRLNKPSNVRAFSGPLIVGGGFAPQHEVRWLNNFQLPPSANVTLHPNALLSLNDFTDTLGTLTFAGGHINLATSSALTVTGNVTSNPTNVTALIDGGGSLGALFLSGQRTLNIGNGSVAAPDLQINARIASGGITKIGAGTLALGGNNFFSGAVVVSNGILRVDHDNALGSASSGTTVHTGATLAIGNAPDLVREPVTLNGTGFGGTNGALTASGVVTLSNNVVLASPSTIRVDSPSQLRIDGVISGTGPLTKIGSGTLTLAGTANNTFSGDTLANAGTLQLDKSDFIQAVPGNLVIGIGGFFPSLATVRHFSHDQIWANVTINGGSLLDLNGYEEYLLTLTLNGGGDVQTGAGLLTVDAGNSITVNPGLGTATSTISGRLGLRTGNHYINVGVPAIALGGPDLNISAQVLFFNGLANIHKNGPGEMRLGGANTFTGVLYVNDGHVIAAHSSALGTTQGSTVVQTNGMLALDGGITTGDFLILDTAASVALSSVSGSNTVNNGINLLRPVNAIDVQPAAGYLQVLGRVGSVGGLTKLGPGTLQFRGSTSNDYAGLTIVSDGVIEAARANRISIPGDALIGHDTTNVTVAAIRSLTPGRQFRPSADVTVYRSGLLELGAGLPGSQETLNTVRGEGRITLGLASSLNISNDVSFDLAARISGSGALNKYRTNTSLHIAGDSTFTGPTTLFEGDLRVDGNIPNSAVTIKRDTALRGDGWVGDVTVEAGGIVNPNSEIPGHLGADLQMNSVDFLSGAILGLTLYGPHPTGGNDSLLVNNAVTLNSTRFNGGFQYAPTEGEMITLIHKTAAGQISGIFNGWPEGTTRLLGEIPVAVSYVGGNGNDLTLAVTNLALGAAGFRIEGGNGDSFVDRNECNLLWLGLQSRRNTALTITHAELRSLTPAGMVTIAYAAYPAVSPLGTVTNLAPFQLSTSDVLNCIGEGAWVELHVSVIGEGTFAVPFLLPTGDCTKPGGGGCESCTIVAGQFTTNLLRTTRVPDPVGAPSECLPEKPCTGAVHLDEGVRYLTHTFTNTTTSDACITAKLHYDCPAAPAGALIVAAYLDGFVQHDACANHIGDAGAPLTNDYAAFSFRVPAGARFEVVVMQFMDVPACSNYSLELFGLPCPRPTLHIARDAIPDNVLLQWSTAFPGWRLQSVDALGGSFQNQPSSPAIVNSRYIVTNSAAGAKEFYRLTR